MFWDPEPEKDYGDPLGESIWEYDEWQKRQVKPQQPESPYYDNRMLTWHNRKALKIGNPEHREIWDKYFDELIYYESHRLRYEGFKPEKYQQKHVSMFSNRKNGIFVGFDYHKGMVSLWQTSSFSLVFSKGISVQLFAKICYENEIELKIIKG